GPVDLAGPASRHPSDPDGRIGVDGPRRDCFDEHLGSLGSHAHDRALPEGPLDLMDRGPESLLLLIAGLHRGHPDAPWHELWGGRFPVASARSNDNDTEDKAKALSPVKSPCRDVPSLRGPPGRRNTPMGRRASVGARSVIL